MALVECKNCNYAISEKAKVCPHCGMPVLSNINDVQLETEYTQCPECGVSFVEPYEECPNCGYPIISTERQSNPVNNHDVSAIEPNEPKTYSITSVISTILAFSLTFFLGILVGRAGSNNTVNNDNNKQHEWNRDSSAYYVEWIDDGTPLECGSETSHAKILDAKITRSSNNKNIVIINFEYTNRSDDSKNLVNDFSCYIVAFQDGVELGSTGWVSDPGIYDCSGAFAQIKDGATIKAQRVWVLRNLTSPVEFEFGYAPVQFTKTLIIDKNGRNTNESTQATEAETNKPEPPEVTEATEKSSNVYSTLTKIRSLTKNDIIHDPSGSGDFYYYNGIVLQRKDTANLNAFWNIDGVLPQDAIYNTLAKHIEGFDMGLNDGSQYAKMIIGFTPSSKSEFAPYAKNASQFIRTDDPLYHILKKFDSLKSVTGTFDYKNDTFIFDIQDLSACAEEMMISEEMLGYIFGVMDAYAFRFEFNGNSCNISYEALHDFGWN